MMSFLRSIIALFVVSAVGFVPVCALAAQFQQGFSQVEQRDANGRITAPSSMRSQYSGNTMTLVINPNGWISILELTGTRNGNTISGKVHHYTNDDCNFTMTRA